MKDSWVGFGYHMALHKANFTSVTAYYQEVFCFLVEIHFPVLFASWRSVFAGVCCPRAHHPKTQRIVWGTQRHGFLSCTGQAELWRGSQEWQHSTSDHLLPQECSTASQLCSTAVPHQLHQSVCSRTAGQEG